jgi:lantibiotic modifying enzyme
MWALHYLAASGASGLGRDYSEAASKLHAGYLAEPDAGLGNPVYMIGEAGILLVELILSPSSSALARLQRAVEASLETAPDLCFGATGAMVATNFAYRRTNDLVWRAILERYVERLWATWSYSSEVGCHLWEAVYPFFGGATTTYLGGCHGVAGNVMALMQVIDLLDTARCDELYRRCVEVYENTAVVEDGCANWWRSVGDPGWGENALLVQWCYGAPGMVTAMRRFPLQAERGGSDGMESLLRQAAALTWRAGPVAKGSGLCHGTAGNGYALLAAYERTGERVWLERARRFAMHAISQVHEARLAYGHGRFTLWTGDLGVAVYLWQCIQGSAGIPSLDYV